MEKENPLRAGFEPAREDPIGFRVQRLNHSAIAATYLVLSEITLNKIKICITMYQDLLPPRPLYFLDET